jgi:HEAT repeat protein
MRFVRNSICLSLVASSFAQDDEIGSLLVELSSDSPDARKSATLRLIDLGPRASPRLEELRRSTTDPQLSADLEEILRRIQIREINRAIELRSGLAIPESFVPMLDMIFSNDPRSATEGLDNLLRLYRPSSVQMCTLARLIRRRQKAMGRPEWREFRARFDEALADTCLSGHDEEFDPPASPAPDPNQARADLLDRLNSKDEEVRMQAAHSLSAYGRLEDVPAILRAVKVSVECFHGFPSRPLLFKELRRIGQESEDPEVRELAPYLRARLGDSTAADELADRLKDRNDAVHALDALGALRARSRASEVAALLDHAEAEIRSAAIRCLARMRAKESADSIAARLDDPESSVRRAAMATLGSWRAKKYAPRIAQALDGGEAAVLPECVQSLGEMGASEYAPAILKALQSHIEAKDVSDSFVGSAVRALRLLKCRDAAPAVADLVKKQLVFGSNYEHVAAYLSDLQLKDLALELCDVVRDRGKYYLLAILSAVARLSVPGREIDARDVAAIISGLGVNDWDTWMSRGRRNCLRLLMRQDVDISGIKVDRDLRDVVESSFEGVPGPLTAFSYPPDWKNSITTENEVPDSVLKDPATFSRFLEGLDPRCRDTVLGRIPAVKEPSRLPDPAGWLKSPDTAFRAAGAWAAGETNRLDLIDALADLAKKDSESIQTRSTALRALAKLGDLKTPVELMRRHDDLLSIDLAVMSGSKELVEQLKVRWLETEWFNGWGASFEAACALAALGDASAKEDVLEGIERTDHYEGSIYFTVWSALTWEGRRARALLYLNGLRDPMAISRLMRQAPVTLAADRHVTVGEAMGLLSKASSIRFTMKVSDAGLLGEKVWLGRWTERLDTILVRLTQWAAHRIAFVVTADGYEVVDRGEALRLFAK